MFVALDGLLILITGLVLFTAFLEERPRWYIPVDDKTPRDWVGIVLYLLFQRPILRKTWTGVAHLIVVFGTFFFIFIVVLDQLDVLLPGSQPIIVSFILDILGVLMFVSVLFFLVKGSIHPGVSLGIKTLPKRLIPLVLLILIIITGFLAEATRLAIENDGFTLVPSAPIGSLFTIFIVDSPLLMQVIIRIHFYLVLLFALSVPFTFMRHAVTSGINIIHRTPFSDSTSPKLIMNNREPSDSITVEQLNWRLLMGLDACTACGRCTENCPAALAGKPLLPAILMQKANQQMKDNVPKRISASLFESSIPLAIIWSCTSCMACIEHCPVYARPVEWISLMRRQQVMAYGELPVETRMMMRNLEDFGDPLGKGPAIRSKGVDNHWLPTSSGKVKKDQTLLWVGCSGAFHPEAQLTIKALSVILKEGGIDFVTLANKELCCGEPAKSLGDEDLFINIAKKNIAQLNRGGVKEIITHCPHCYHLLKNEYPELGGHYAVRHSTELIVELIQDNKIELKYALNEKQITIHDPCYLGRANNIYQPLRDICKTFPGARLTELNRHHENAFCCGGGGGNMWLHDKLGSPINQLRAKEIDSSEAKLAATACPFCLTMLRDGLSSLEKESVPKAVDIAVMVASSMGFSITE